MNFATKIKNLNKLLEICKMGQNERPRVQIPLPPPAWEEYIRAKEQEQQEKENLDDDRGVIIIDI